MASRLRPRRPRLEQLLPPPGRRAGGRRARPRYSSQAKCLHLRLNALPSSQAKCLHLRLNVFIFAVFIRMSRGLRLNTSPRAFTPSGPPLLRRSLPPERRRRRPGGAGHAAHGRAAAQGVKDDVRHQ